VHGLRPGRGEGGAEDVLLTGDALVEGELGGDKESLFGGGE